MLHVQNVPLHQCLQHSRKSAQQTLSTKFQSDTANANRQTERFADVADQRHSEIANQNHTPNSRITVQKSQTIVAYKIRTLTSQVKRAYTSLRSKSQTTLADENFRPKRPTKIGK